MAKQLKLWNVRGWGRPCYEAGPDRGLYLYPEAASHIYLCAHSRAHAARLMAEHLPKRSGFRDRVGEACNELKNYASEGCWGKYMEDAGIEPEVGIWVSVGHHGQPEIKCVWKESDNDTE